MYYRKQTTILTTRKLFLLALVLALAALQAAAEDNPRRWDGDAGVFIDLVPSGPGEAVTLWGVYFNDPGACSDGVCGEDDIFDDPVPARTAVAFLSGQRVPPDGRPSYGASYGEGSTVGSLPLPTRTLEDAQGAEIHLVLRTHGDFRPELADEQITTFGGGCEVEDCEDVQFAVFRPQDADADGHQTTEVRRISDGSVVAGARASLWREADGIRVALHTRYR